MPSRAILATLLILSTGAAAVTSEIRNPQSAIRNVDTHHLFTPPAERTKWEARKAELRHQILFSAGLSPMPKKTPLKPTVTGRIEGPDYIIENVAIQTYPGFYLCGNLYKPKGKQGPFPAIVNPHGHWEHGRLEMEPDVPIASPPPAPMGAGKGNLVAIGVNLARQGYVVFAYDMVGYNDTNQIPDHRAFANDLRHWLWGVSLLGLQLWNSIRAVDYLESLPEVDKTRIGATGASGGGTQTFLLTAVDDRIACSVPVNMISAYMQGGCLCENGPGLRVGTDNVEIGAMMAPKPLLLVSATGDWTSHVPNEEWPAIRKVYDLYGAGDKTAVVQFNYGHNYNIESREAMYAWFGKWLLHDPNPAHFKEKPFEVDLNAMRVWNDQHPMPSDALKADGLTQSLIDSSEKQLAELWPKDKPHLVHFQEVMRPALAHSLGVEYGKLDASADLDVRHGDSHSGTRLLIVACKSDQQEAKRLAAAKGGLDADIVLLDPVADDTHRLWAEFFTCYNRTALGDRVQAIMNRLVTILRDRKYKGDVDLIGMGQAGIWALLARGLSGVDGRTVIDTAGFDNTSDEAYIKALYAPGLRRAGDLRTAAVLAAPQPLCLYNTGGAFKTDPIQAAYHALHAPLRIEKAAMSPEDIAAWLKE